MLLNLSIVTNMLMLSPSRIANRNGSWLASSLLTNSRPLSSSTTGPYQDFSNKEKVEENRFIRRTEEERRIMSKQYLDSLKYIPSNTMNPSHDGVHYYQLRDILGVKYKELPPEMINNLLAWKKEKE